MSSFLCPHCHQPIDIDSVMEKQQKLHNQELETKWQKELADQKNKFEAEEKQRVEQLKRSLWEKAQEAATEKIKSATEKQQQDLLEQLKAQKERAEKAESVELTLRKKQRELEDKEKQLELSVERKLDERLKAELLKAGEATAQQTRLREQELRKQLSDTQRLLEEAQRKSQTVSQQLQGEVQELALEKLLAERFPLDTIEEVKKGQFGADVLQHVKNARGQLVGTIVWESKQTSAYSPKWLAKLREDVRSVKGDIGVLVSTVLPEDIELCGQKEGVWITAMNFAVPLAELLRHALVRAAQEKSVQSNKETKVHMLFEYVSGHEFRSRVESIVESFREMHQDLEREERTLQLLWKKREKQLLRLATNTAYMYGEMQGLMGSSLPTIQGLELESGITETTSTEPKQDLFSEP